jgi:di/tricarboxylate transporter
MMADYALLLVYGALVLGVFVRGVRPGVLFAGAAVAAWAFGALDLDDWAATLGNRSLLTIFALTILAGTVQQRLGLTAALLRLLPSGNKPRRFLGALVGATSGLSGFINNTPLVALLIPFVRKWAEVHKKPIQPLLMPMAFAATAGGMLTVFGTSTNLVLNGLLEESPGLLGASMPDTLQTAQYWGPGLTVVILTGLALIFFAPRLLRGRTDGSTAENPAARTYTVETLLLDNAQAVGKTVAQAGFRNLHGLFLVEIMRSGQTIAPVGPDEVLVAGDRLFFAGDLDQIRQLTAERPGLALPQADLTDRAAHAPVVEVLVPNASSLVGQSVKQSNFRERFGAAIVAIHRRGQRLGGRIGDQLLQAGDLLVLVGSERLDERLENQTDLYPIGERAAESAPGDPMKIRLFLASLGLLIVAANLGWTDLLGVAVGLLFVGSLLGFVTLSAARKHLDLELLLVLSSSLALGQALVASPWPARAVEALHEPLHALGPFGLLAVLFLVATALTNAVTNNAAVALMFPLAAAVVVAGLIPPVPAFLAIAFGASNAFLTPIGYQTNLMVMGPGGYTGRDYLRMGWVTTAAYSTAFLGFAYFFLL